VKFPSYLKGSFFILSRFYLSLGKLTRDLAQAAGQPKTNLTPRGKEAKDAKFDNSALSF
jgi:hypothetical protein